MAAAGAAILPRGNVQIANSGNRPISFQIRPLAGVWTTQTIPSGGSLTFNCTCAGFEVAVTTDNQVVTRTLQIGQSYRIFWNEGQKSWDIAGSGR